MPSFEMYRKMLGVDGVTTVGQAHKRDSDLVMEATWDNDIETRTCYLYDYWHDNHKDQLRNLHPEQDKNKIPISLKYIQHSSQTYDKDKLCPLYWKQCKKIPRIAGNPLEPFGYNVICKDMRERLKTKWIGQSAAKLLWLGEGSTTKWCKCILRGISERIMI